MSNIMGIQNYKIDGALLYKLVNIYKLIGTNNFISESFAAKDSYIQKECIEKSCILLNNMFNFCSAIDRSRLVITKDSKPKNYQEQSLYNLKQVLIDIFNKAKEPQSILNPMDFVDYLKKIYGKQIKISTNEYSINNPNKKSVRYLFIKLCDEYNEVIQKKNYESLIISFVFLMELYNLKPFEEQNELAFILIFYYLMLKCEIAPYKYLSLVEIYKDNKEQLLDLINNGSVNYDTGVLYFNDFVEYNLKLIEQNYKKLNKILAEIKQENRAFKHDNISKTIMELLPNIFTKEEVKKYHPDASDSTIVRALNALKDKKYITPLGTGRSAKWQKLIDINDPRYLFGDNYDQD